MEVIRRQDGCLPMSLLLVEEINEEKHFRGHVLAEPIPENTQMVYVDLGKFFKVNLK